MSPGQLPRSPAQARGPERIRGTDIDAVNAVFAEAFTDRYRRDGMTGVRVPQLNPAIWRYAIEAAGEGALLWRDQGGEVVAFNVAHRCGTEGWMGPLAVRPEWQGTGLGRLIVETGILWLQRNGCRTIGLETMPRTMENIGFYSRLGFAPGHLTVTVTLDASTRERPVELASELSGHAREVALEACRALTAEVQPGYDFHHEAELTLALGLGDVVLLRDAVSDAIAGFAILHTASLVEGRAREEARVLKLVLRDEAAVPSMATALEDAARRAGTRRVAIRVQTEYEAVYRELVSLGARIRWTDLRMTLLDYPAARAARGVLFSNWEI